MMAKNIELSVVVPAYNEAESINDTLERITETLKKMKISHEVIVVDDGSTDQTKEIAQKHDGVLVVSHRSNRGYGAALKTGLRNARGEWIFITDADGTYPIEDFPRLWEQNEKNDMVVGSRNAKSQHISWTRKPGKMVLSILANYLVGKKIPDLNSGMRLFRKELAMEFYHLYPQGFSFTITITLASLVNRYAVKYVPVTYSARKGKSKMNVVRDGLSFIGLIIRIITYFNPGKILYPIAGALMIAGILVGWYSYFIAGMLMDDTTALLLLSGLQIFLFAVIMQIVVQTKTAGQKH
jgi:glycosyltransferase involved in cell wall biosynthesis